ncbi:MAG: thiosulfate oxidation carrier protein SoxY [Burkholderiaceae bacterium]
MNQTRRSALRAVGGVGAYAALVSIGLLRPGQANAEDLAEAFRTQGIAATLKALGAEGATESDAVEINAPDIAENGAVVPVGIGSKLPDTEMLALLVEKNPNALAGAYDVVGIEPRVNMRIKMGQSSDVVALVRADGKYYMARKEVKVTLGGCGG